VCRAVRCEAFEKIAGIERRLARNSKRAEISVANLYTYLNLHANCDRLNGTEVRAVAYVVDPLV